MLDLYKKIILSLSLGLIPFSALASDDVGYYTFGQYRYFSPKLATDNYYHSLDNDINSAHRFYPNIAKQQFSYLKNSSRTINETIGYGDWDKPYRVMSGFEHDYKHNKSSKSNYGYKSDSNSFFLLGDKAYYNNYFRFGGGVVLTQYDTDYVNNIHQKDENFESVFYGIYNDSENQIRWRLRGYLGYGESSIRRASQTGTDKSDFNSYYYGLENIVSKTFQSGVFFVQPQAEFNGLGVNRGKIDGSVYDMPQNDSMLWYGAAVVYVGIKGKDNFNNSYSFKVGPEVTRNFSDPYDSFYSQNGSETLYFKARPDERDYVTWKAYLSYNFENGLGLYSDFRYYMKDADSTAMALGVNYRF